MPTLLLSIVAMLAGAAPPPKAAAPRPGAVPPPSQAAAQAAPAERPERAATGGELLARASSDLARLHRALREVLDRVEDARHERDLVKLICADEKLSQIKALVTVAERAETALTEAVATHDEGAAVESSKIAIARGKVDGLRTEAAACIGQLAYEVSGSTAVQVEVPGDLPRADAPFSATSGGASSVRGDDAAYRHPFGIPSYARR